MNSYIAKRIISIVLAVLVLSYIAYQIYNTNYSQTVQTETAIFAQASSVIQTEGVLIRKESVVTRPDTGVLSYELEDGERVAAGGVIASVYTSTGSAAIQKRKEQVDNQIAQLQTLNAKESLKANPENLNNQAHLTLYEIIQNAYAGNTQQVEEAREELLFLMNEWQIITGKVEDFNARISSLQAESASLTTTTGEQIGSLTASVSGYFVSELDGYEGLYDYNAAEDLTVEDLQEEKTPAAIPDNAAGKICEDFDWYAACIVPANQTSQIRLGTTIMLTISSVSNEQIPVEVVAVNQTDRESDAAVILQSDYNSTALNRARTGTFLLETGSYEGVRVSQRAIHFETLPVKRTEDEESTAEGETSSQAQETREVRGVYVLHGQEIKFVQVFTVYSDENYVICKTSLSEEEQAELLTEDTITLYDEVVVGGSNLYDGKIVK